MQATVSAKPREAAKREIMKRFKQGISVQQARRESWVPMHRTTVYRLLKRVQSDEESAFVDGRHGHAIKLRGEVLAFLMERCQTCPDLPSSTLQRAIEERFSLKVSVSQLNRVRASLGLTYKPTPREKKPTNLSVEPGYIEGAGGLLLLAAATETGLLIALEKVLPTEATPTRSPLASRSALVHQRLLLTLLFLGVVGLHRTWDLRSYTGGDLALLTGRKRAYGYHYTEAFLSQIAHTGGAESFTGALARWTTDLWHPEAEDPEKPQSLTCYIDGHRKPVYSEMFIPRGLIGRLGVILGCRALVLLHDDQGHPLLVTTHRGDQHLTVGLPSIIARYEESEERAQIKRIIVDREGMATEFLARLHAEGRAVVTILQTTQYRDLSSFSDVGPFVPLSTDAHGHVIREVAPARIALSRKDHPDSHLSLRVALIRDLRRLVPVQPDPEEASFPSRWDSDLPVEERTWWGEGWQATAAPAKETTAKLIPIVTTEEAPMIDAIELAQTYIHRWPVQENVIKEYLLPLGLDTNHGFAKVAVENSEVAKRRTFLEQRLARLKQWAQSAGKREAQASRRRERLRTTYNTRSKELYRELTAYQFALEEQNLPEYVLRRKFKERKTEIDAELEPLRIKEWQAYDQCNAEFRKQERYCKEQREVLRALEDLKEQERSMHELDNRKNQVMTVCKVALANLAMWVRDRFFPASYAQATWKRLLPFFRLPGTITSDDQIVHVQLRPFNDRALNRDLAILCEQVNWASPHLPDGRRLSFTISSACCILAAQKKATIP